MADMLSNHQFSKSIITLVLKANVNKKYSLKTYQVKKILWESSLWKLLLSKRSMNAKGNARNPDNFHPVETKNVELLIKMFVFRVFANAN